MSYTPCTWINVSTSYDTQNTWSTCRFTAHKPHGVHADLWHPPCIWSTCMFLPTPPRLAGGVRNLHVLHIQSGVKMWVFPRLQTCVYSIWSTRRFITGVHTNFVIRPCQKSARGVHARFNDYIQNFPIWSTCRFRALGHPWSTCIFLTQLHKNNKNTTTDHMQISNRRCC